jgi:hypothetical protein
MVGRLNGEGCRRKLSWPILAYAPSISTDRPTKARVPPDNCRKVTTNFVVRDLFLSQLLTAALVNRRSQLVNAFASIGLSDRQFSICLSALLHASKMSRSFEGFSLIIWLHKFTKTVEPIQLWIRTNFQTLHLCIYPHFYAVTLKTVSQKCSHSLLTYMSTSAVDRYKSTNVSPPAHASFLVLVLCSGLTAQAILVSCFGSCSVLSF